MNSFHRKGLAVRHWIAFLLAILVVVPATEADEFKDIQPIKPDQVLPSPDPGAQYSWTFGDQTSRPSVHFQVKPHGDWVKRFPLFKIENPTLASDCFAFNAQASFNSGKESGSAQIEFWADLSDGSHVVSKAAISTNVEPEAVDATMSVGSNVWPVRCGVDVVVTGSGTVRLEDAGIGQTDPVASPPVTEAIRSDERIFRHFSVAELDPHLRASGLMPWNGGTRSVVRTWGFSELADGATRSSFLVGYDVPFSGKIRLLNIDHPAGAQGRFAVAGRVTQVATQQTTRDGLRSASGLFDNFSLCRLEMTVEPDTGPTLTTSFRMSPDADGQTAAQLFRLAADLPAGRTVRRMSLDLVMPRGAIEFDGIDLIVPGVRDDGPPRAMPSRIPPDRIPVPVDDLTPLMIDPAVVHMTVGQAEGPLTVESESANGRLDQDWQVEVKRPTLDGSPRRLTVVAQDVPMLKSGTFGITGAVSYEGPTPGSDLTGPAWFELTTDFADGSSTVTGTMADFGPAGKMTGHSTRRPFVVTATSALQPVRFKLALVCTGTGIIHLSPLSLVTYEPILPSTQPTSTAAPPAPPLPPPWWAVVKFTRPIGFAVVGLMALAAAVFLIPGVAAQTWGLLMVLGLIAQAAFAWGMFLLGRGMVPFGVVPLLAAPLAWMLPAIARGLVTRRVRQKELRKMFTLDAVS